MYMDKLLVLLKSRLFIHSNVYKNNMFMNGSECLCYSVLTF